MHDKTINQNSTPNLICRKFSQTFSTFALFHMGHENLLRMKFAICNFKVKLGGKICLLCHNMAGYSRSQNYLQSKAFLINLLKPKSGIKSETHFWPEMCFV